MTSTPWTPANVPVPPTVNTPPLPQPPLPARVADRQHEQLSYEQELARRATVLELRLTGMSPIEIAEEVGYTSARAVQSIIDSELSRGLREPAEHLIHLELLRLDRLLKSLWQLAIGGHTLPNGQVAGPDADAVDRVLRIMERRAKLLGL